MYEKAQVLVHTSEYPDVQNVSPELVKCSLQRGFSLHLIHEFVYERAKHTHTSDRLSRKRVWLATVLI